MTVVSRFFRRSITLLSGTFSKRSSFKKLYFETVFKNLIVISVSRVLVCMKGENASKERVFIRKRISAVETRRIIYSDIRMLS